MRYRELEKIVLEIIKNSASITEAINKYFKAIHNPGIKETIKSLSKFDYETDYINIANAIKSIISKDRPKINIKAYWFGIFETISDEEWEISLAA